MSYCIFVSVCYKLSGVPKKTSQCPLKKVFLLCCILIWGSFLEKWNVFMGYPKHVVSDWSQQMKYIYKQICFFRFKVSGKQTSLFIYKEFIHSVFLRKPGNSSSFHFVSQNLIRPGSSPISLVGSGAQILALAMAMKHAWTSPAHAHACTIFNINCKCMLINKQWYSLTHASGCTSPPTNGNVPSHARTIFNRPLLSPLNVILGTLGHTQAHSNCTR